LDAKISKQPKTKKGKTMQLAATNSKVRKTSSWLQQQMQEPGKLPALCCKTSNCLENLLHAAWKHCQPAKAFRNRTAVSCLM
jgi:hypothetical protein